MFIISFIFEMLILLKHLIHWHIPVNDSLKGCNNIWEWDMHDIHQRMSTCSLKDTFIFFYLDTIKHQTLKKMTCPTKKKNYDSEIIIKLLWKKKREVNLQMHPLVSGYGKAQPPQVRTMTVPFPYSLPKGPHHVETICCFFCHRF